MTNYYTIFWQRHDIDYPNYNPWLFTEDELKDKIALIKRVKRFSKSGHVWVEQVDPLNLKPNMKLQPPEEEQGTVPFTWEDWREE